jgi:hypothetical protein
MANWTVRNVVQPRLQDMKTPIVTEIRRAGRPATAHAQQRELVTRSLLAVPPRRTGWDERTRTESRAA